MLRRVLAENAREYTGLYILAIICLLAVALATAAIPWVMKPMIDDVFYSQRFDLVPYLCAAMAGVFIVRGLATYGHSVVLGMIGNNLVARYQQRIFDHLMRLGLDFYTEQRSGQLAARVNENVLGVRDMLSMTLRAIVGDAVMLLALIIAMIVLDPTLSIIALLIGPPLIYVVNAVMRRLRRVARQAVEVNSRLVGAMQEATQGIAVVKAFTMEEQLSGKVAGLIAEAEGRANKIVKVSERVTPITEILAGFAVAGVLAYSAWRAQAYATPPGAVFGFITALLLAYDPARRLARVQVNLERSLVNARMIYEILDLAPRQRDRAGSKPLAVDGGEIRLEEVSFGYVPGQPVLRKVSFTARAGEVTAIVGGSGAGKSTIVALIEGFHDLDGGRILVDGQDIAGVTRASLRTSIAYVSQHPYLFEGTIRDNVRYGRPDASDAEVEEAARLAYADEFIRTMPQGYDTPVGENGVTLSGGQRQRLSIARAIIRNAAILLLDEATSALDAESEARVQAALETVMKDRTTIVIAHRLSTVVKADNIVVMEQGRVVEQGTHAELLRSPVGVYARFHQLHVDHAAAGVGEGI
ncbi:ABC transporter ATP-binding protein [Aquamicrobium zhengzhouense]|uniref:ABC transporter ATP-binding protein n=1 Tax=Aquamicrobium zhengzhouense TaxID=2781738 RepID=UPI002D7F8FD0|nr:ABC transporter ATP-binding protein [Aquamicrobium zhengzhouense]